MKRGHRRDCAIVKDPTAGAECDCGETNLKRAIVDALVDLDIRCDALSGAVDDIDIKLARVKRLAAKLNDTQEREPEVWEVLGDWLVKMAVPVDRTALDIITAKMLKGYVKKADVLEVVKVRCRGTYVWARLKEEIEAL